MDIGGSEPASWRRRWTAIAAGTAVVAASTWSTAIAIAVELNAEEGGAVTGPALGFGLALIPFAFIALAFISKHHRAPMAVVKGMGLFLAGGFPVMLVNPVIGMVFGFGLGGMVSLRREEGWTLKPRLIATAFSTVYITILLVTITPAGLVTGPFLPFIGLGVADRIAQPEATLEANVPAG